MKIDKESKIPLYHQLYEAIARDIESGIFDENEKLPSERELCNTLGISRSTVRQAMYELEKDGYIYKEHGRGMFVSFESFKQNLLNFYSFTDEMIKIGKEPSSKVLKFEEVFATAKLAEKLGIEENDKLYQFTRLRLADEEPIILETTYLPAMRFPGLSKERLEKQPMYEIFREDYEMSFSQAKEIFKSVLIRNHEAEMLEVNAQIPGMMIERYTYEQENIVEYTISIARGDKFEYIVTLENKKIGVKRLDKLFGTTVDNFKNEGGYTTASEIYQQPSVWEDTLKIVEAQRDELNDFLKPILAKDNLNIIFSGAGTSGFIGDTVVPHVKAKTGHHALSLHTTDIVAEPEVYLKKDQATLLLSFARSGNSPESVATIELAKEMVDELYQVVITCNKDGQLAKNIEPETDKAIILPEESNDKGLAMTSSYTSMVLASLLIFDLENLEETAKEVRKLFPVGEELLNDTSVLEEIVDQNFKKIVYLGTGSYYGLARESSLKLLELTQGEVITRYDTPLGFRHGPKAIVDEDTLIVMYLSRDAYTRQYEIDLLKEIYGENNPFKILVVSETADEEVRSLSHYHIALDDAEFDLEKAYLGIDYVIVAQILSVLMSKKVGINPDNPSPDGNINRVVEGVTIYPFEK